MFWTRLGSGILLVAAAIVLITAGGPVLAAALCLISVIAYRELGKALGFITDDKKKRALEYTGTALTALYYIWVFFSVSLQSAPVSSVPAAHLYMNISIYRALAFGMVAAFIVYLFAYVLLFPAYHGREVTAACFSFLYAPVMLSFLYLIRDGFLMGKYLVWFVFLCSWGSDTCAYAVGVLIGKHKMTPKLSPKKSIEGAVGGVVGAALLSALYACLMERYFSMPSYTESYSLSIGAAAALGAAGALVSMVGDLAASAFKRDYGIKDYGKLIPGHGGIMDRFDSMIVTAPLIFIGLSFIMAG